VRIGDEEAASLKVDLSLQPGGDEMVVGTSATDRDGNAG